MMAAYRRTHRAGHSALSESWQPRDAGLHLSDEPGELLQVLCHDESTKTALMMFDCSHG